MIRSLAGLLALLLLATVAGANTPTDHPYHTLQLTEMTYADNLGLNPQDNYCYATYTDRILKSNGGSWSLVCDMSDEGYAITSVLRPFFTAAGDLLITGLGAGMDSLWKAESTDYTVWTSVLEWPCSDHVDNCKTFASSGICEAGTDTLFVGQYCGDDPDSCATIWRSDDAGDTWTEKFHMTSRHIHGVWWDSLIDSVYASVGDHPDSQLIIGSPDRGENWTVLRRWDGPSANGPLSFAALPGIRFFGSDAPTDVNSIFSTTDDAAFTDTLLFPGDRDGLVWVMSQDAEGVIYAGTVKAKDLFVTDTIAIYYRMPWDDGKWYKYDLGTQIIAFRGVTYMTEFDASGYAYFTYFSDDAAVFKFRRSPTYTIGTAGDYATIAAALAGAAASGDTLILLAGQTHAFSGIDPPAVLTIRGATSDRDLYTMMQTSANADGINVDDNLTLKNLTMREKVNHAAYDVSLIQIDDDDVVLTLENVRIAGVDGGARDYPGLSCVNREPALVTFSGCHFDSIVTTGNYAAVVYATNASGSQLVMENSIISNCSSARSPFSVVQAAAADTVRFTGCLFVSNSATDHGGAVRFEIHADSDPAVIGYCTFDGNASGDVDDGQISFLTIDSPVTMHHTIITNGGSTWAIRNLGAADITAINHCDTWGNGRDAVALIAAAFTDTLHQDPDYNRTGTYATGWYQGMDCNICNIAGGGTYMGWEQWLGSCQRDTVGVNERGGHKRAPHSKRSN